MYVPKKTELTKEQKEIRKKQFEKDHTMVKGRFTFKEVPGATLVFSFFKYKEDGRPKRYELVDGETYTLPYMVAKHLATNVYEDVYQNQVDKDGRPIQVAISKRHRTGFERIDFDDDNFVPSTIITVDKTLSL